jgi:hypothetical protein
MVGEKSTSILSTEQHEKLGNRPIQNPPKMYHNLETKSPQTRRSHALTLPTDQQTYQSKSKIPSCPPHKTSPKSSSLTSTLKIQYFPPTPSPSSRMPHPPIPPRPLHQLHHKPLHPPHILAHKAPNAPGIRVWKPFWHTFDVEPRGEDVFLPLVREGPEGD